MSSKSKKKTKEKTSSKVKTKPKRKGQTPYSQKKGKRLLIFAKIVEN
jgi:hypothetical protein